MNSINTSFNHTVRYKKTNKHKSKLDLESIQQKNPTTSSLHPSLQSHCSKIALPDYKQERWKSIAHIQPPDVLFTRKKTHNIIII